MFRRRTDHIYTTLQNVQRRITQGTEGDSSSQVSNSSIGSQVSGAEKSAATQGFVVHPDGRTHDVTGKAGTVIAPVTRPLTLPASELVAPGETVGKAGEPSPETATAASANPFLEYDREQAKKYTDSHSQPPSTETMVAKESSPATEQHQHATKAIAQSSAPPVPKGLLLTPSLASVVMVLWALTLAVAYHFGSQSQISDPLLRVRDVRVQTEHPATLASGAQDGQNEASAVASQGNWIVIIDSVQAGQEDKQKDIYESYRDKLNPHFASKNYGEHFGLRFLTQTGGLQFVYGMVEGRLGISKTEAKAMLKELKRPGRFPDAYIKEIK